MIGGGAAGFFCAVNAARIQPALEVLVIEKSGKLLSKVKVSGGGRCNVTHASDSIADMIGHYPRGHSFLKKAFHHFFTTDTVSWFEQRGVKLKAEPDGRMFPITDSSQTIIDCFLNEATQYGVQIMMNAEVKGLSFSENKFIIQLSNTKTLEADFVCMAGGGYAKPEAYYWLQQTGHHIELPVPSLFTFNMPGNNITALMGVTVDQVSVKMAGTKLSSQGSLLITHWGMSGPAVLKLSAWGARVMADCKYHFKIFVNWIPDHNEQSLREKMQQLRFTLATQKMANRNPFSLPSRLWEYLMLQSGIPENIRWADLPAMAQNKLIKNLCVQEFDVKGRTGFKEEFVTAGGVSLADIDVNTMQSKIQPGLFFAGEVMDVDGVTGGFNFQQAWTSGWIAAKGIGKAFTAAVSDTAN